LVVQRGGVYYADLEGDRTVLVVSADAVSHGLRSPIVCQITRRDRDRSLPTYVFVEAGTGGLPHDSYVLCHELATLDEADFRRQLGVVSAPTMVQVEIALRRALDLP
jgi:mRNA-degrading endonuclease toxin of MazEF toxin-antitoxin module